jgi:ssDNA-binding Zn-finger/Zn-ribbon topoisomerase 1
MSYTVPLHEGPVMCPYCNCEANHVDSKIIYGRSFGHFYLCSNYPECDARVGAAGVGRPVGTLAREELRELRKQCHAKLDPLWKDGEMTRTQTYEFLQKIMRLMLPEQAHIGRFDERRCRDFLMRIDCDTCRNYPSAFGPSHSGSRACRQKSVTGSGAIAAGGTDAHCSCAGCF